VQGGVGPGWGYSPHPPPALTSKLGDFWDTNTPVMFHVPYRGVRSVGPVRRAGRFCYGHRGCRRTYLTIIKRAWSANFKMVWYVLLHSGSISSKHPDINFFFFVLYVSCNLCDDVFEEKKYFSHKMWKIGPCIWRNLRILVCKSRFLPFFVLFLLFSAFSVLTQNLFR
jgi:hypothetical protein